MDPGYRRGGRKGSPATSSSEQAGHALPLPPSGGLFAGRSSLCNRERWLYSGGAERRDGRTALPTLEHEQACVDLDFSPDGKLLLTASIDGNARLWDLATGKLRGMPLEHSDWVYQARFSSDGQQILTAGRDRAARLWDVETGRLVSPPMEHSGEVFSTAFSPDGRWIYTVTNTAMLRVWERRTGKPVTRELYFGEVASNLSVGLDGQRMIAACGRSFRLWDLGVFAESPSTFNGPAAICRWAELVSMKQFVPGGGAGDLTPAEWLDRWRAHRADRPVGPAVGK